MVAFEVLAAKGRDPGGQESRLIPLILRNTALPDWILGLVPVDWTRTKDLQREWIKLLKVLNAPNLNCIAPGPPSEVSIGESDRHSAKMAQREPSAISSAFRMPKTAAELMVLFEFILDQVNVLENVCYTFGEIRRMHEHLWLLRPRVLAAIYSCEGVSDSEKTTMMAFFQEGPFDAFLREADFTLPRPSEKRYTRDRTHLKRDKFIVQGQLRAFIDDQLGKAHVKAEFLRLESDPTSWLLRGFSGEAAFKEYLQPSTKTLFERLTSIEREMLIEIDKRRVFTEEEMTQLGIAPETVTETTNCLIRDQWLKVVDFSIPKFELTVIGGRLLRQKLSSI
jgi:hypothetical protein